MNEVKRAQEAVQAYIALEFTQLLEDENFANNIHSSVNGDEERIDLIYERLEALAEYKGP